MRIRFVIYALIFAAATVLYTFTLNTDVQAADSGELQLAAIKLGIPHPPGYPLFTMLGWLFSQVPFGSPFARVSFLSVVASVLTLVFVAASVLKISIAKPDAMKDEKLSKWIRLASASAASLALGVSTTFWSQATTTNIRSLTALFAAAMIYAALRVYAEPTRLRNTIFFIVALGLGIGHHLSLVFVGGVLSLFVIWRSFANKIVEHQPKNYFFVVLAFLATQLVWLYLPIRDAVGARFAPGDLNTLNGFLNHVFARGFEGDQFYFVLKEPQLFLDRLALLPTLLRFQFSDALLVLMGVASVILFWQKPPVAIALLLGFALHLFVTLMYRAPQTVEYALPCWVIMCVVLGGGSASLLMAHRSRLMAHSSWLITLLSMLIAFRDGRDRLPSYIQLSQDRSVRVAAESALNSAFMSKTILAQWHQATPMWALQEIEGINPKATVEYVFPRGAQPYAETFAERAREVLSKNQNVLSTSFFVNEFERAGLQTMPSSDDAVWSISHNSRIEANTLNPDGTMIVIDDRIEAFVAHAPRIAEVGAMVPMIVQWRANEIRPGDSISVRIFRNDGRLAANADVRIDETMPNKTHTRRVVFALPLDLELGAYDLVIGAYRPSETGFVQYKTTDGIEFVASKRIEVLPASQPPATQREMSDRGLIGVDYDTGIPNKLRLLTHWRLPNQNQTITVQDANGQPLAAPRELPAYSQTAPQYFTLVFDIPPTLNVQLKSSLGEMWRIPNALQGERYVPYANQIALIGGRVYPNEFKMDLLWLSARSITTDYIVSARLNASPVLNHDSVPALGAIPTLKWIRGSRILDRHVFQQNVAIVDTNVVVYDSATQTPLPPLDERYENRIAIPSE
jgi:hypothetical protein